MAKFIARCDNQVLIMKPDIQQIVNGMVIPIAGKSLDFERGSFETNDKEEIAFIRKHRLFGSYIFEETAKEEITT